MFERRRIERFVGRGHQQKDRRVSAAGRSRAELEQVFDVFDAGGRRVFIGGAADQEVANVAGSQVVAVVRLQPVPQRVGSGLERLAAKVIGFRIGRIADDSYELPRQKRILDPQAAFEL